MVRELKPKRGEREFELPRYARMRALEGMSYAEIADSAGGKHVSTASKTISRQRPRMGEFVRAKLKEMA